MLKPRLSLTTKKFLQVILREVKKKEKTQLRLLKGGKTRVGGKGKGRVGNLDDLYAGAIIGRRDKRYCQKAVERSGSQGEKEIGKVMTILAPQVKGKADGAHGQ